MFGPSTAARALAVLLAGAAAASALAQWVSHDARRGPRGPWNWSLSREHPLLYREFNGIDFGHAHLAQTILRTLDDGEVEKARLEVLDFIFSSPSVPPDENQVTPEFTRMAWEVQRSFNWAHTFHRSLYDLFTSDEVNDKEAAYRRILADYLEKPEAITPHRLDHHGRLWSFPESKVFRDKFPKFNSQIWAYHWLQAAAYDVQLMGDSTKQRELMPAIIRHYHGYLREPPVEWQMMPMMMEAAPEFTRRFPEAAAIFDNLHMLHDNVDDILCRPDLYPTRQAKRDAMLRGLAIYLHRNHEPQVKYPEYHAADSGTSTEAAEHGAHTAEPQPKHVGMDGNRPPSAADVLEGRARPEVSSHDKDFDQPDKSDHEGHPH